MGERYSETPAPNVQSISAVGASALTELRETRHKRNHCLEILTLDATGTLFDEQFSRGMFKGERPNSPLPIP